MSSRIEQIIEEIEEYIDRDCKFQPLSTTKIIVNKEHLDELLRERMENYRMRSNVIRRLLRTEMRFLLMQRQKQMQ